MSGRHSHTDRRRSGVRERASGGEAMRAEAEAMLPLLDELLRVGHDAALDETLQAARSAARTVLLAGDGADEMVLLDEAQRAFHAASTALSTTDPDAGQALAASVQALSMVREALVARPVMAAPADRGGAPLSVGEPALFAKNSEFVLPLAASDDVDDDAEEPARPSVRALFADLRRVLDSEDESVVPPMFAATEEPEELEAAEPIARTPKTQRDDWLHELARDCLETIGALGVLRSADGRTSDDAQRFEARMLRALDALMALGEPVAGSDARLNVQALAFAFASETFVDEPFRGFAFALTIGCTDDQALLHDLVLRWPLTPKLARRAQADALALASHPRIDDLMRSVLRIDHDPGVIAAALVVLRQRVAWAPEAWLLLRHVDAEVRIEAARYWAAMARYDGAERLTAALEREPDEAIRVVLSEGLLRISRKDGLLQIRRALEQEHHKPRGLSPSPRNRLMMLLALGGTADDGVLLRQLAQRAPASARALGWHGAAASVEPLLTMLASAKARGGETEIFALVDSLQRIVGERPTSDDAHDVGAWRALWDRTVASAGSGPRFRLGERFRVALVHRELSAPTTTLEVRRNLALELAITSATRPLQTSRWIATQQHALARHDLPGHDPPGRWPPVTTRRPRYDSPEPAAGAG